MRFDVDKEVMKNCEAETFQRKPPKKKLQTSKIYTEFWGSGPIFGEFFEEIAKLRIDRENKHCNF